MEQVSLHIESEAPAIGWLRKVLYVFFIGTLVFEILNFAGILSFRVDYTWLGRVVSSAVLFSGLTIIDWIFRRFVKTRLPISIWIMCALLLWSDFVGDIFGFYTRFEWYDQLIHFSSGPILSVSFLLAYQTIATRFAWKQPRSLAYITALGLGTICAVLYELEEYFEDYFYGTNRLGDGFDTANDLLLSLVGSIVILVIVAAYQAFRRRARISAM